MVSVDVKHHVYYLALSILQVIEGVCVVVGSVPAGGVSRFIKVLTIMLMVIFFTLFFFFFFFFFDLFAWFGLALI